MFFDLFCSIHAIWYFWLYDIWPNRVTCNRPRVRRDPRFAERLRRCKVNRNSRMHRLRIFRIDEVQLYTFRVSFSDFLRFCSIWRKIPIFTWKSRKSRKIAILLDFQQFWAFLFPGGMSENRVFSSKSTIFIDPKSEPVEKNLHFLRFFIKMGPDFDLKNPIFSTRNPEVPL